MTFTEEQASKLQRAEEVLGYSFSNKQLILSAITHPSATEGRAVKYSYERLEFLGDSILGAIVADVAFERFHELDEGGLTRIKVALVSGASLVRPAVGTVPLAVRLPAVPQHCAQLQYAVSVKLPRYFP